VRKALRGAAVLAVLTVAGFTVCALLPRYPSKAPRGEVWPEENLEKSMNPWFLAEGFSDRIAIEVDWVAGCKPGPQTIDGLRSIATKYAPAGVPVDVELDDEIPRAEWDATGKRSGDRVDPLVRAHADFAHEPCDAEFRTAHFYVLFAPGADSWFFGYSGAWYADDQPDTPVDGIVVFHDPHARLAKLWLSCDRMEAMTVVHEYGHQLGLVANETHERTGLSRGHCTSLSCLMAQPSLRVYAHNAFVGLFNHFPSDYCRECREDIRRTQAAWRARLVREPGYRAKRAEILQTWYWSVSIHPLVDRGDFQGALAEIARARLRYPDSGSFAFDEIRSLTALGRFDEAAVRLRDAPPDRRVSLTWTLARELHLAGRYDEAIALFDRDEVRRMEEYQFEQSAFILVDALEQAGRLDEAIALIDEMLARGPATSYIPEGSRAQRADLLRRAGRVPEALAAVEKGLGSRKTRHYWYATASELLDAAGRHEEAQALLREWLDFEEKQRAKASTGGWESKWRRSWTIARVHLLLGESERLVNQAERRDPIRLEDEARAREAIAQAGDPPEGTYIDSILWAEVPVLVRLHEWDRAAGLIRSREKASRYDVCGTRDLAPLREDPRYADLFEKCVGATRAPGPAAPDSSAPVGATGSAH
jgi:pentatricopeptide repeat protein